MKRKVNKKNYNEGDNFDRKAKKNAVKWAKKSKKRLSIYDEFDEEDLINFKLGRHNDFGEEDD